MMKQLSLSSLLFMYVLLLSLMPCLAYSVELTGCIAPGDHDAITFLMVDRTDQLESTENLKQSLVALEKMIQPSERLIVGVSTGKASQTRILIDTVRPKKSLWVSKLKIRAAEKKFDECYQKMSTTVLEQSEKHERSALLETMSFVGKAIQSDTAKQKRIVIFSDMVQNSAAISFYRSKSVDPEKAFKKVKQSRLLVSLPQADVHVAGVGTGISDEKARAIEAFWSLYFTEAGATLKYYGPILLLS